MNTLRGIVLLSQVKCFKMYASKNDKYMFLINQHVLDNENMCYAFLPRILFLSTKKCKVICMLEKWMDQHIDRCCYSVYIPWRGCHV